MKTERGFTLLEVMVALLVFALVAGAVLTASQFILRQSVMVRERLFVSWLADNHLSELRLQLPQTGRLRVQRAFAGQQWTLEQRVERDTGGHLLSVELEVRREDGSLALQREDWIAVPMKAPAS